MGRRLISPDGRKYTATSTREENDLVFGHGYRYEADVKREEREQAAVEQDEKPAAKAEPKAQSKPDSK